MQVCTSCKTTQSFAAQLNSEISLLSFSLQLYFSHGFIFCPLTSKIFFNMFWSLSVHWLTIKLQILTVNIISPTESIYKVQSCTRWVEETGSGWVTRRESAQTTTNTRATITEEVARTEPYRREFRLAGVSALNKPVASSISIDNNRIWKSLMQEISKWHDRIEFEL